MSQSPHLHIAVSGHGFGHAAQLSPIATALRDAVPDLRISLAGALPPAAALEFFGPVETHIRLIDFVTEQHFSVIVKSVLQRTHRENITILEREYDTFVIREDNEVEQLGWSYTNVFWVDAETGFVWRSTQYFSPKLPPIEIDILKPAG